MATANNSVVDGSPRRNTLALTEWRPILHASNQVVLYNPTSHALSIQQSSPRTASVVKRSHTRDLCPYCHRRLHTDGEDSFGSDDENTDTFDDDLVESVTSRVPNYFQLLEVANETSISPIPSTPGDSRTPSVSSDLSDLAGHESIGERHDAGGTFRASNMAEGYFKAFFQEECRLGMGANGSVYLCQVGYYLREEPTIILRFV